MGLHKQTVELIERQEYCQDIKRYVESFGIKAAERKFGINQYRIRKILEFQQN